MTAQSLDASCVLTHAYQNGAHLVRVAGVIDERFQRQQLLEGIRGRVVFLDLEEVRRITSYGVREWMGALRALSVDYCGYIRCRPALVMQFNMVANFACGGELISFYAPYVCPGCEEATEELVDLRRQHTDIRALRPPTLACPKCGAETELDDAPESFFSYAASAPLPRPPVQPELLLEEPPRQDGPFHVGKDVEATVTALWFSGSLNRATSLRRLADGLEGQVVLVAQGVSCATGEGVDRLRGFLQAAAQPVYLARLPPFLAVALSAEPQRLGEARVVSLQLPVSCRRCQTVIRDEIPAGALAQALFGAGACGQCGEALQVDASAELLECLARLPVSPCPPEVSGFLSRHLQPPVQEPVRQAPADDSMLGRYHLGRLLGTGGMAQVFLARQVGPAGFEKRLVVKRLLPHLVDDPDFVSMFLDEARLAARVSHPNVVQIFDLGQVSGQYFIAMEYVQGFDLQQVLQLARQLNQPIPVEFAARVVSDVCAGLHAVHTCSDESGKVCGFIHRDVSPHNVLVSNSGAVRLADFGIAKAVDAAKRTPTTQLKGKLAYLAPELLNQQECQGDGRVDVYAAGIILYQLLTLTHPFLRPTEPRTLHAILFDPLVDVREHRPDCPPQLAQVLLGALERDVNRRTPSALAMHEALEECITRLGRPGNSATFAAWLEQLVAKGRQLGTLPPELAGTPVGELKSPSGAATDPESETRVLSGQKLPSASTRGLP